MYIVHVTTEYAPIAKVGGLGDVVQGLTKACAKVGQQVEVILPFYHTIQQSALSEHGENPSCPGEERAFENGFWKARLEGVDLTLIKSKKYFHRNKIYGEKDDICRFAHFSLASLKYLLQAKKKVDVLHLHDWPTALCAPLQREIYQMRGLIITSIVTTIHNLAHQGRCEWKVLAQMGSMWQELTDRKEMRDDEKKGYINCLKGGIIYSDLITTVSKSYARQIQVQTCGLGRLLTKKVSQFKGILNGIDIDYWNPATDPFLKQNFSPDPEQVDQIIRAKKENRIALSSRVGISYDNAPLFIGITRLVTQKGPELIKHGMKHVLQRGGQFILIGTPHEEKVKKEFDALAEKYQGNQRIGFYFKYDEALAHLAYASAHFILIPSLFEPCGLTQMIAMRYATLPIAHKVGGLKETVFDVDDANILELKRNGYTFDSPSKHALRHCIDRAFTHFQKETYFSLIRHALRQDWSWNAAADHYLQLYFCLAHQKEG